MKTTSYLRSVERHLARHRIVVATYRGKLWYLQKYRDVTKLGNALVMTDQLFPITPFRRGEHWSKPLLFAQRRNVDLWDKIFAQEATEEAQSSELYLDEVGDLARDAFREMTTRSISTGKDFISGTG